jgi:O-antigen/teichoic acid export membrane protein
MLRSSMGIQSSLARIAESSLFAKILSGSSIALIGDMATRGLSFIVKLRLTEALGLQIFGEYTTQVSALGILGGLLGFGLDTWLLREGGRNPESLSTGLRSVLTLKLIAAVTGALVLAALNTQITLTTSFVIGCLAILGDSLMGTSYAVLRVMRRYMLAAASQISQPALLLLCLTALSSGVMTPAAVLGLQAGISFLVLALLAYLLRRVLRADARPAIQATAVGAAAFVGADILANIYSRSSILLLRLTSGSEAVGVFTPALDLMTTLYIVPSIVFGIALPILSRADIDHGEYRSTVRALIVGSIAYGAIACLAILIGADAVFTQLYPSAFFPGAGLLKAMALAPLFKALSFVFVAIMLSRLRQTLRMAIQTVIVVLNVLTAYVLLSSLGAPGAPLVTLATECLLMLGYAGGAWAALHAKRVSL